MREGRPQTHQQSQPQSQQSQPKHKQPKQQQKQQQKGGPREFDFSRFGTRHIALQLAYEGDRYLGFSTRVGFGSAWLDQLGRLGV